MKKPPLIFDLDGTLVDSVYLHVAAFQEAFSKCRMQVPLYHLHRRIGMGSDRLLPSLASALHLDLDTSSMQAIMLAYDAAYASLRSASAPLPGAREIWRKLHDRGIKFAIATSAKPTDARELAALVEYPSAAPLVTGVARASSKPAPDLFELAASKLGVSLNEAIIVGDSTWDMLASYRARSLGVGVLTGGFSIDELSDAGAFRVYADLQEMGEKLDELGV